MLYKDKRQILLKNIDKLQNSILHIEQEKKHQYVRMLGKLEVLNPILTIQRGYSIVKSGESVVDSVQKVGMDDVLSIELKDGIVQGRVIHIEEKV